MKLAYLIYNERPTSGLFKTQVLGILDALAKHENIEVTLISIWQPWVYLKNLNELEKIKKDLDGKKIKFVSIPLAFPNRYFFQNSFLLKLNVLFIFFILRLINLNSFDVVHCRGYFISYISALLKREFKLIFDLRSLFPEENIIAGNWKVGDKIFKKWKEIESFVLDRSNYSIVVSRPMLDVFSNLSSTNKIKFIPIGFHGKSFQNTFQYRDKIKGELGIANKKIFAYCGSLDFDFWNDLKLYGEYFINIVETFNNSHVLILTNSNHEKIIDYFKKIGLLDYTLLSVSSDQVPYYLAASDIGLQVMNKMFDSNSRFGVKTIEYWASGLPVLTNDNVGGICNIIKDNPILGVVVNSKEDLKKVQFFIENEKRDEIQKFAFLNFEFSNIALKYISLYKA